MTNWLAEARHRQGYTQASLAEHCGVSVRWIQAAEAGARSYGEPARRVAEALGADSIDTLWKYTILPGRPHRARRKAAEEPACPRVTREMLVG
jgi:transcriptional regulator with XRE-family HTH domain